MQPCAADVFKPGPRAGFIYLDSALSSIVGK